MLFDGETFLLGSRSESLLRIAGNEVLGLVDVLLEVTDTPRNAAEAIGDYAGDLGYRAVQAASGVGIQVIKGVHEGLDAWDAVKQGGFFSPVVALGLATQHRRDAQAKGGQA